MYTESTKRDERSARGRGGGGGRFHRNSGRMGAPSNATILRLAGLDKHRWDNGRLKQLVALETRNGRGPSPGSGNFAISGLSKDARYFFFGQDSTERNI